MIRFFCFLFFCFSCLVGLSQNFQDQIIALPIKEKLDIYNKTISYIISKTPNCSFNFKISDTLLTKFDSTGYNTWGRRSDTIPTSILFNVLFNSVKIRKINSQNITYTQCSTPIKSTYYLSVSDCIFFDGSYYTYALVQLRVSKQSNNKVAKYYTYYLDRIKGRKNWIIIRGK